MRRRFALTCLLTTGLGAACSTFGSSGDDTPPGETSTEDGGSSADGGGAGSSDASAPVDAGVPPTATPDSGWVPNGGFEQGGDGCGLPWQGPGATLALDARARSGASACLFCSSTFATLAFDLLAPKPGSYTASAWVRVVPADAGAASVTLRLMTTAPALSTSTSSAEWTRITATRKVVGGDGSLLLGLESPSGCFLVDDVVGEYAPP